MFIYLRLPASRPTSADWSVKWMVEETPADASGEEALGSDQEHVWATVRHGSAVVSR